MYLIHILDQIHQLFRLFFFFLFIQLETDGVQLQLISTIAMLTQFQFKISLTSIVATTIGINILNLNQYSTKSWCHRDFTSSKLQKVAFNKINTVHHDYANLIVNLNMHTLNELILQSLKWNWEVKYIILVFTVSITVPSPTGSLEFEVFDRQKVQVKLMTLQSRNWLYDGWFSSSLLRLCLLKWWWWMRKQRQIDRYIN